MPRIKSKTAEVARASRAYGDPRDVARSYARIVHIGHEFGFGYQTYFGYLESCVEVLARFEVRDPVAETAMWLHRTMERDPSVDSQRLRAKFGDAVLDAVFAVRDCREVVEMDRLAELSFASLHRDRLTASSYVALRRNPVATLVWTAARVATLEYLATVILSGDLCRYDVYGARREFKKYAHLHRAAHVVLSSDRTAPMWAHLHWLVCELPRAAVGRQF